MDTCSPTGVMARELISFGSEEEKEADQFEDELNSEGGEDEENGSEGSNINEDSEESKDSITDKYEAINKDWKFILLFKS